MNALELRVAFPYDKPASFYDPLKIHLSPEYTFLENTFSPLVEYTPTGELVSAVAERFQWVGNEAHFHIRSGLKTIDGQLVTAKDVELSLKRMMIIGGNTHGDLKDMLCPGLKISSLEDVCPGLEVRNNDSVLVMKFNEKKTFLFPMLAAIDFAVIPRQSIHPKTFEIRDYRNTSGPYYVERDSGNGVITLAANPNHFHYSCKMPQVVHFVPAGIKDPTESLRLFSERKIDLITTIDQASHDLVMQYAAEHADCNVHKTYPLRTYAVTFTQKGRKRFSVDERIAIGRKLKEIYLASVANRPGYEPSEQLFSVFGESALSQEQIKFLRKRYASAKDVGNFEKPMTMWIVRMSTFDPGNREFRQAFPNGKIMAVNKVPGLMNFLTVKDEEPDFIVSGPDMGFLEDIGLLSYYLSAGYFHLSKTEGEEWLRRYMALPDKNDRMKLMKALHFRTVVDAASIPMAVSPYTALARKPWTFNLSKVQASDAIWRIFQ